MILLKATKSKKKYPGYDNRSKMHTQVATLHTETTEVQVHKSTIVLVSILLIQEGFTISSLI